MLSRGVLLRSVGCWLAPRVALTVEARGSIFQRRATSARQQNSPVLRPRIEKMIRSQERTESADTACFQKSHPPVFFLFSLCYLPLEKLSKSLIPLSDCRFVLNRPPCFSWKISLFPGQAGSQKSPCKTRIAGRTHRSVCQSQRPHHHGFEEPAQPNGRGKKQPKR
jgi:hypothetical protein